MRERERETLKRRAGGGGGGRAGRRKGGEGNDGDEVEGGGLDCRCAWVQQSDGQRYGQQS